MQTYDLIVVGAGPAGASAARRGSQLGLRTLVLDRAVFPRDKLCGGAVSEGGLSSLDFNLPQELVEQDVHGARVYFGDTCSEARKPYRVAAIVNRAHFDEFLLRKAEEAGATVLQGRQVSSLDVRDDSVEVVAGGDGHVGRIVIGSDGFQGITSRYVRPRDRKSHYGVCMQAMVSADERSVDSNPQDLVDIHLGIAPGGYGWVFPHNGCLSVGIGGLANRLTRPRVAMREFLAATGFTPTKRIRGCPIPVGGIRRDIFADRMLLAGDAAGFVDAFVGEGISYAIRSGQLAAETASIALYRGDCTARGLKPYELRCERAFSGDLRYSLRFSRLMHLRPGLFLRMIASSRDVTDRYVDVIARRTTYAEFLGWLLPRIPFLLAKAG